MSEIHIIMSAVRRSYQLSEKQKEGGMPDSSLL
jgi:hypothetical protein